MSSEILDALVAEILEGDVYFLEGVRRRSSSWPTLFAALVDWSRKLGKPLEGLTAGIEPSIRQSILFSLIPEKALHPPANASYDALIDEHLRELQIQVSQEGRETLRDLVINIVRLRGLTTDAARAQTAKLGTLKADNELYLSVRARQGDRCIWCGVNLSDASVMESLEHMLPKHIGDDPPQARNWAIACTSCNSGKRDHVSWSTSPFAFDFFERNDFQVDGQISLTHRWTVICRDGRCGRCGALPSEAELFVYKRVRTGLSIPTNCATICGQCCVTYGIQPLGVAWDSREAGRSVPT